MAVVWWALVVLRAVVPPALAVATGWLVGAVGGDQSLVAPLATVGVLFVAMQTLGPLHTQLAGNLGDRASATLQDRLMVSTTSPAGIAHLEDPDLAADFSLARDFDLGLTSVRMRDATPQIGSGFASFGAGIVSALVVCGFAWWAGLVLLIVWLSPHVLLRDSVAWKEWGSAEIKDHQRHAEYAYRMAVDTPAAKEIRLFGLSDWVAERFTDRRQKLVALALRALRMRERSVGLALLVLVIGNGIVFAALARAAISGDLGLSRLVAYAGTAMGVGALANLEFDWWLSDAARPVPLVNGLLQRMRRIGGLPAAHRDAAGLPRREIRFEDVSFGYPHGSGPILRGLDLRIEAGRSLAIVGQNGTGKTTLVKLLARLYDPTSGRITVDGIDLRELDVDAWRGQVAAAFQDFVRYQLSLRDNVAPHGAPDPLITEALDRAGATGLADLDTVLSKQYAGGTDLSGGQWQRVALARALAKIAGGAKLIILDEPTAQLDVRGEAEVFERILQATRGITTILVSHRFSTVRHADRICVVEDGQVIEYGSHDELLALGGRYRTMFDLQASRFDDDAADDHQRQPEVTG
jgi:ATP-binding cassette subfamily B protein